MQLTLASIRSMGIPYQLSVLLHIFILVYGNWKPAGSSFSPINGDLYHSSEDLLEKVKGLSQRHPGNISTETYETGNKGYRANVTVVTYCQNRKKIHDGSMFRILLSFGQHGRELITSELALKILSILSGEQYLPHSDPFPPKGITDRFVIKVVPIENLNGRRLVESGQSCERRNGRGVDLNRNWSVDWGEKEKDYDPHEEDPGTSPFSEPESQIMRQLAISFKPHVWVNVHSGMEALFMPYDHKNTSLDGPASQKMKSLLEEINTLHCHNRCTVGSGGGSVGYLAHGTATDYMYDVVKVPMAFTFEIYGDGSATSNECFKMFNPTDVDSFQRVMNDWCLVFFTLFKKGWSDHVLVSADAWESMHEYLIDRNSRYGEKRESLDLGMQEMRTYFRLFLMSTVLLIFMFCTRISKSKCSWHDAPPVVSTNTD